MVAEHSGNNQFPDELTLRINYPGSSQAGWTEHGTCLPAAGSASRSLNLERHTNQRARVPNPPRFSKHPPASDTTLRK